jgi:hypothetical protein
LLSLFSIELIHSFFCKAKHSDLAFKYSCKLWLTQFSSHLWPFGISAHVTWLSIIIIFAEFSCSGQILTRDCSDVVFYFGTSFARSIHRPLSIVSKTTYGNRLVDSIESLTNSWYPVVANFILFYFPLTSMIASVACDVTLIMSTHHSRGLMSNAIRAWQFHGTLFEWRASYSR